MKLKKENPESNQEIGNPDMNKDYMTRWLQMLDYIIYEQRKIETAKHAHGQRMDWSDSNG